MASFALAACLTLALTGPGHAGLFATLLRDFNFVALEHGADVREARLLGAVHASAVGIVVDHGTGPRLRAGVPTSGVLAVLGLDGSGLGKSSKVLVARVWEIGQAISSSGGGQVEHWMEIWDSWVTSCRHNIEIVKVVLLDVGEDAADDVHSGTLVTHVGLRNRVEAGPHLHLTSCGFSVVHPWSRDRLRTDVRNIPVRVD